MKDAGLLTLTEGKKVEGFFGKAEDLDLRITWEGHEFLEKVRDEKLWKSIVKTTKKKTGGLSFDILKAILIATLKKAVGIEKGSGEPNKKKVGKVTKAQLREIALKKMEDLNTTDLEQAIKIIKGTAKNMGITIE